MQLIQALIMLQAVNQQRVMEREDRGGGSCCCNRHRDLDDMQDLEDGQPYIWN